MSVVFLASEIDKASHLWMQRQVESLAPDIDVALDTSIRRPVRVGGVTVEPLADGGGRRWTRVWREAVGERWAGRRESVERRLEARLRASPAQIIFVEYLTAAVRYSDILTGCRKRVFVRCNGWDITWDMRSADGSGAALHPPDYVERVRRLAPHVTFIANSRATRDRLTSIGIDPGRIVVHYYGLPVPKSFTRGPRRSDGPIRLLYLGRLIDFKGPDLVIRAFEQAVARGVDARLTLAGDGPLRAACALMRHRSAARDRIEMIGSVDAAQGVRLRADADLFIAHNCTGPLTNQAEAFGVAFVEAMADGLPVLSGRSGGLIEIVEEGQTGVLVEPGDVAAQAEAIVRLADSPDERLRMGKNGWQRAARLFSDHDETRRIRSILGLTTKTGA